MAKALATQPFTLIETPDQKGQKDGKLDEFDHLASTMTVVHNALLRGLNAIYLQAPSSKTKSNLPAFLHYCRTWYSMVHAHHSHEESRLFPQIEQICGQEGLMSANIEQHHAFEAGIDRFAAYVDECLLVPGKFEAGRLKGIIESFGEALSTHLVDEIANLQGLRAFGEVKAVAIHKAINDGGAEQIKERGIGGLLGVVPCLLGAHDLEYEGGKWNSFPPAPGPVLWMVRNVIWKVHSDWWAFGPCDSSGRMRELDTV